MRRLPFSAGDRSTASHDAGLQAERTSMAWQRTALGVGGVSALLLHDAKDKPLTALPGALGLGVALALLVITELRYEHTVRKVAAGQSPVSPRLMLLLAASVSTLAASAIALILVAGA